MSAELLNKAQREADRDKARRHPRLARASARLAVAVAALFESDGWGGPDEEPRVSQAWGGGLVAAVDGMRFVVPVPAAFARPKQEILWLQEEHDLAERHQ